MNTDAFFVNIIPRVSKMGLSNTADQALILGGMCDTQHDILRLTLLYRS